MKRIFYGVLKANSLFVIMLLISFSSQAQLMLNEFDAAGSPEAIELVVTGSPCEMVDLRGFIIDDNNGDFVTCGQALSKTGIAKGFVRFKALDYWSSIPAGTVIYIPSNSAGALDTDFTDYQISVPLESSYFEVNDVAPSGANNGCDGQDCVDNNGVESYDLDPLNFTDYTNVTNISNPIGFRNSGDACQLRNPDGSYLHGMGYGHIEVRSGCTLGAGVDINGGPDNLYFDDGDVFTFVNTTSNDYRLQANWVTTTSASLGSANSCENAEWIASLRRPLIEEFRNYTVECAGGGANVPLRTICGTEELSLHFLYNTDPSMYTYTWVSNHPSIVISGGSTSPTVELTAGDISTGNMATVTVVVVSNNPGLYPSDPSCVEKVYTLDFPVQVSGSGGSGTIGEEITTCSYNTCYNPYLDNANIYQGAADAVISWYLGNPAAGGTLIPQLPTPCFDLSGGNIPDLWVRVSSVSECLDQTIDVTENILAAPTVSIDGDNSQCASLPISLEAIFFSPNTSMEWTAQPGGGSFSDPTANATTYVPSNADILNGSVSFSVVVTDNSSACPSVAATHTTSILPEASAGTAIPGGLRFCADQGILVNLNDLLDGESPGGTWTETTMPPSGGLNGSQFVYTQQAEGTYTFRYTIDNTNGCPSDSEEVSVEMYRIQTATVTDMVTVCNNNDFGGGTTLDFNSLITAGNNQGDWTYTGTENIDLTDISNVDFLGFLEGSYIFNYTTPSNGFCPSSTYSVEVNLVYCSCDPVVTNINYSGCEYDQYGVLVNGQIYDFNNPVGQEIMRASNGCDSIININLDILPNVTGTISIVGEDTICEGSAIDLLFTLEGGISYDVVYNDEVNSYTLGSIENGYTTSIVVTDTTVFTLESVTTPDNSCIAILPSSNTITAYTTVAPKDSLYIPLNIRGYSINCKDGNDGSVAAHPTGGRAPYQYLWSTGERSDSIYGLSAGDYTLTITDASGCEVIDTAIITAPDTAMSFEISRAIDPSCFDGRDGRAVIDTVIYGWADYEVSLDGYNYDIVSLPMTVGRFEAGTHTIYMRDSLGCTAEASMTLENPIQNIVQLNEDTTINLGESVLLFAQYNFEPDSIIWTSSDLMSPTCSNCEEQSVMTPFDTRYTITVMDSLGCVAMDTVFVKVIKDRGVFIPNAFSPNNDGVNDYFTVQTNSSVVEIAEMQVYNRWGEVLYQAKKLTPNSLTEGWDGTFRGEPQRPNVFVYVIKVVYQDGEVEVFTGDITLIR